MKGLTKKLGLGLGAVVLATGISTEVKASELPLVEVNFEDGSHYSLTIDLSTGRNISKLNSTCDIESNPRDGGFYVTKNLGNINRYSDSTINNISLGPQIGCERSVKLFSDLTKKLK